jgi:uncharacterized protein (TIGR03790 family)
MPRRLLLAWLSLAILQQSSAESLSSQNLGVIFNAAEASSVSVAAYYSSRRHIPPANVLGLAIPDRPVIKREELLALRQQVLDRIPSGVQSLLLVWSRPFAVECMSITTAMAAGYRPGFCAPGCGPTTSNPLFDSAGWLPADTVGWLPAMLLPSRDETLARAVIDRGIAADGSAPAGTVYLVRTQDAARNVRASSYDNAAAMLEGRIRVRQLTTPIGAPPRDIIGYFTGAVRVAELPGLEFRPGAAADHLTSSAGVLEGSDQMTVLEWLRRGATASYGAVSEPCNLKGKFPDPEVLINRYLRGDSLLEAYWKSVAMPGQGLFVGEPLAKAFTHHD